MRRHYDRLFRLCRRLAGNDADAYDATQEALLAIVRGLPRFDSRASFGTWAYRVTTNACLDELRRRRRRPEPTDGGVLETQDADDVATAVADRITIDDALASLPDEFRVAVVLRDVCGLDYADIAAVLDIPPGTVRSRIARGRVAIADRLGGNRTRSRERQTPRA